jgi:PAS domain S-box-containing protein
MAQDMIVSKLLSDILPIANSSMKAEDIANSFSKTVSSLFGIEKVSIVDARRPNGQTSTLYDYVSNTKKTYIDNALSSYSSFPELIEYGSRGYRSYAAIPLMAEGKVVSVLELFSNSENKFTDELLGAVNLGAVVVSFVLMYKNELGRSIRLATYFDAAFNNTVPQFIIDGAGNIIRANKSATKAFGTLGPDSNSIKTIIGVDPSAIKYPPGASYTNIVMGSGKNKTQIYEVIISRINENMAHVAANDVTDAFARSAEDELIGKSEDICTVLTDINYNITSISLNSSEIFGYGPEILAKANLIDLITKVEQQQFKSKLEQDFKEGKEVSSGAFTLVFSEQESRYMRFVSRRFLEGYMLLAFRADAEKYVENARKDFEDFIRNSSDIVLKLDRLCYITDCNMTAENMLGIRKEDLVGKDVKSIYVDQDILNRDINYVRTVGKVDNSYINLLGSGGRQIPATHSVRLLNSDSPGGEESYVIIIKELETKRKLESQGDMLSGQTLQLKKLETQSALKSQFIYNISHELKTPLTNIKGFSKLLYDGEFGTLTNEQKEYIKTTLDEADRLMLIIQQILDAAKLEAEKVKLEYKDVDFRAIANNPSIISLQESAKNKGLSFDWTVAYDVPIISADFNRLIQVFVNLIGNAIKFTNTGSITVKISRKNKRTILCEVVDTGIGINEDDKKKLFRRKFYEAAKKGLVQQQGAGTGLGLSISRDIIKLHSGKIDVDSKQGTGSNFWFTIPISQRQKKRTQTPPAQ